MPALGVVVVGARAQLACSLLSGVPVVARSVRGLLGTPGVTRVDVLCRGDAHAAVVAACSGLPVRVHDDVTALLRVIDGVLGAHAGQRSGATEGDGPITLVVHDALRPLAPAALGTAVIAAVRDGGRAAVPVLPLSDTVKQVDAGDRLIGAPDRSGLRVVQTPQAFAVDLAADVLRAAVHDPVSAWTGVGGIVPTVPGDPLALALHEAGDLERAAATLGGTP